MEEQDMGFQISNLTVKVEDNIILNKFSLTIKPGEIHVIMGPNGAGKSTLSKVIMGDPHYQVLSGTMQFEGNDLSAMTTDERARLGIFLAMQNPLSIEGVSNSEFLRTALREKSHEQVNIFSFMKEMEAAIQDLHMDEAMLHRSINEGFSGGERKKNEILQMKLLKPKFIILDELDSGLDVDSLKTVSLNIKKYLEEHPGTSVLMITHYPRILEYLHPDFVHVLKEGKIVQSGTFDLALQIEKMGYDSINAVSEIEIHE